MLLLLFYPFSQVTDTAQVRAEVDSLFAQIDEATKQRNFDEALSILDQAERNIKTSFGEKSGPYADLLNKRGTVFYQQGAYGKAEPFYLEVLTIKEQVFGKEHLEYARTLNDLGIM